MIALTGATGFIGQYVTAALLTRGWRVRALVRGGVARVRPQAAPGERGLSPASLPGALRLPGLRDADSSLKFIPGGLEDSNALRELVRGTDAIVHLAGAIRGRNYRDFAAVNVTGTSNLIEACLREAPLSRFVHISSLAARQPDLSWYARSKHAGEEMVAESGLSWSGLRPPAVYGPEDPAMAPVWRNLAHGRLLRAAPRNARFSLLFAADLAEAVCRLIETPASAMAALEIDDGRANGYSYPEMAQIAAAQLNRRVRIWPVPAPLLRLAGGVNLAAARITGRRPILTPGKVRELTHPDWVCDNTALEKYLDWCPGTRLEHCIQTLPGWENK